MRWYRQAATAAGIASALIGAGHLAAWLSGVMAQRGLSAVTMKTNTALCLLLLGVNLVLLMPHNLGLVGRRAARACAAMALLIGARSLSENLVGWDLGIDQLLARELPGALGVGAPNRMGTPASTGFVLAGAAMLLLGRRHGRGLWAAQGLALAICLVALLSTIGYLYGVQQLYGLGPVTGIAWPTAAALLLTGVGMLCARPDEGPMAQVTADDPGGLLIRRLLLPMVLIPMGLGWVRLAGERLGWFDAGMGTAMMMLIFIITFSSLAWFTGRRVSQATGETERQRSLLAVTLASIGDAVIVTDLHGRVTFLNGEAQRLTAWTAAEAQGQPLTTVFRIINEQTRQDVESPVDKVLRLRSVVGLANHTVLVAKDGRETPIDDSGAPIRDSEGNVMGVVLVFRDIVERRAAEEAMLASEASRKVAQAVEVERARLNSVLDLLPAYVVLLSPDYHVPFANRFFRERFGESRGKRCYEYLFGRTEACENCESFKALKCNAPYHWEWTGPDGRNYDIHDFPFTDVDGSPLIMEMGIDITERKRAEAALKELNETLEQRVAERTTELALAKAAAESASRAKDQFIAVLSHELRTPLTPALAAVATMQNDMRLPGDVREDLAMVQRNIDLEVRLIADLLDVSRIISGKLHLEKRPVDVAVAIREAAKIVSGDLDARSQTLTLETPGAPYLLLADAARLQQVFWNLLRNAIKFTPQRGRIAVRAAIIPVDHCPLAAQPCPVGMGDCPLPQANAPGKPSGGNLIIKVIDAGSGIDPDVLPRLFTAFEQGQEARSFGGLGLGLSICKAVIDLHGGSITAHSDGPGKGATFTITLPVAQCPLPGAADRRPETHDASSASDPGRPALDQPRRAIRILLVEDHADTAKLMARLLMGDGHEVSIANSVAAGLAAVEQAAGSFDLLISDLGLPDGSGHDLMRQLLERGAAIPGIALSGYGAAADIEKSNAAGFAEHLTKPTIPDQLNAAIQRVTASHKLANARRRGS